MNYFLAFIPSFVDWLVMTSFMATIIAVLIFIMNYFMKDLLPMKWQYMLWFVLLVRMLVPWAPESSISVFNMFTLTDQQNTSPITSTTFDANTLHTTPPMPMTHVSTDTIKHSNSPTIKIDLQSSSDLNSVGT